MSDRNVLFGFLQRDPGGQKTLLIKDLSPEMDHDSLMANLMTACRIDVDEVYIMTESPGVAMARLSEDILDIQKLQERVWDRGFNGDYPTLTLLGQSIEDNCLAHCVRSSERPVTAMPLPSSNTRLSSGFLSATEQSPSSRAETSDLEITGEHLHFIGNEIQSSGLLFTTEQSPSSQPEAADTLRGHPQILDVDLIKDDSEHPMSESACKDLPVARVSPLMVKFEETDTEDDEFQDLCDEKRDPVNCDDMPADVCSGKETLQPDTRENLKPTSTQSFQVGSISLEVKMGQIARQKAEVLVNVVSPDGKLEGSISQAFFANGGDSFPALYNSAKDANSSKRLVCTDGSGHLKCSKVFHVRLQRKSPKVIVEVVQEILLECKTKGFSTLAMPPLGVGHMYGYSSDTVAHTMFTYLSQYGEKTDKNMLIGIVIFDDETYRVFCDVFASLEATSLLSDPQEYVSAGISTQKPLNDGTHPDAKSCLPQSKEPNLEEDTSEVFAHYRQELQQNGRRSNASLKGMNHQTQKSREKSAHHKTPHKTYQKHDLARNKDDHAREGRKEHKHFKKGRTQEHDRKNRNEDKENALRYARDMCSRESSVPSYWTIFYHKTSVMEKLVSFAKGIKFKRIEIPAESRTYRGIVSMVNSTFHSSKIGMGKDAVGLRELGYSKLHVMKIERIENPQLFKKYEAKRKELFGQLIEAHEGNFPAIATLPGSSGAVQVQDYVQKNLENDIHPQLNEMLLFHGTMSEYVDAICNEGPDFRLASENAMFGRGIYTAERSQKADQYADDPKHRTGGKGKQKKMFLLRILLGNSFLCSAKDPPKYCRPPCTNTRCLKVDCSDIRHLGKFGHFFHSVVGDTKRLFREFVVYEKDLCYPEYLITYERL